MKIIKALYEHTKKDTNFKYHAMIAFGCTAFVLAGAFLAQFSIVHAGALGYATAYFVGAGIEDKQTIDRWDSGSQNSNQERFLDMWCTFLVGFSNVSLVLLGILICLSV